MTGYRSSGPTPKRDGERVRRNEPEVTTTTVDLAKLSGTVTALQSDENWHSVARLVFDSLHESAQVVFWEPSDWAIAYLLCTNLDRELKPQFVGMQTDADGSTTPHVSVVPLKGASLGAYIKGFTNLLMTEVDRRRAGIEINRATQLGVVDQLDAADNVVDFKTAREKSVGN
ncbi:MAG: hypothetical protein H7288_04995 [Kineosporiaceae bacterium]|nr:hypothetical protein [Aeromicrobium sp.]